MRVEWLEKALKNLEDEANYIALDTREWAVSNWSYLISYRVRGDRLQVFGVFHTRQRPRTKW